MKARNRWPGRVSHLARSSPATRYSLLWPQQRIDRAVLVGTRQPLHRGPVPPEAICARWWCMAIRRHRGLVRCDGLGAPRHSLLTVVPGGGHFFHGQLPLLKTGGQAPAVGPLKRSAALAEPPCAD